MTLCRVTANPTGVGSMSRPDGSNRAVMSRCATVCSPASPDESSLIGRAENNGNSFRRIGALAMSTARLRRVGRSPATAWRRGVSHARVAYGHASSVQRTVRDEPRDDGFGTKIAVTRIASRESSRAKPTMNGASIPTTSGRISG